MISENIKKEFSAAAERKMNNRCFICGKIMTAAQEILPMDGKQCCDACYRDSFFADMDCHCQSALDHCNE